jgi:hypothetical protein
VAHPHAFRDEVAQALVGGGGVWGHGEILALWGPVLGRGVTGHGRSLDWISPKIDPVSASSIGLMAMNLPLSRMSLQEKLVAMELLWADLSATPDQVVSPAWHGEELQRRREQVQQGSTKFLNWDDAIAELKTQRHEHQTP